MIPPASTRALLLGAILAAAGLVAPAMGDTFFFGYEGIGDGNSMSEAVAQAQPLVDYLSSEIPQHDFQLKVYLPTPADEAPLLRAVNNREVDFWIADQRSEACLELASHKSLVTMISTRYGSSTAVTAGTIVTLANTTSIQTLDDIADTRVATCESPLIPATVMGSHLLRERGLDLLLAASQVQRYSRLEAPLTALLAGEADVAILEAGVLESMVADGVLAMDAVRVLEEIVPSALPYRHTTRTYPNQGVMSSKYNANGVAIRNNVKDALLRLDPSSPAATAMHGGGWTSSVSNMAVVTVLESMDMLELVDAALLCHGRTVWQCPSNALQAGNDVDLPCSHLSCPSGARCTCQPCILGDDVSLYPVMSSPQFDLEASVQLATDGIQGNYNGVFQTGFLVAGSVPSCRRTEDCQQARIGQRVTYELRDYLASVRGTAAIEVAVTNGRGRVPVTISAGDEPGQWVFSFVLDYLGQYSVSVKYGGEHAAESPFFTEAIYHTCPGANEAPTPAGGCVCDSGYTASGGKCVASSELLATQVVPAVVAVILLCIVLAWLWRRHSERQLLVPYEKLEVDSDAEDLGSGSFGRVIPASYNGQSVAVKMLIKPKSGRVGNGPQRKNKDLFSSNAGSHRTGSMLSSTRKGHSAFVSELRTMSKLKHPNVVLCLGGILKKGYEPMLILERMEGTLSSLLTNDTLDLGWDILSPLLRDIVFGLGYLHQNDVIHCDLKSTNVLVDSNLRAKISDFGLAAKCKTAKGSPPWMAPELLRGASNTRASDIYALGILFSEMLTRQLPYTGMDLPEVLKRVAAADETDMVRPALPSKMPAGMQALVHSCWPNTPEARLTIEQVALQVEAMEIQSLSINLFARRADAKSQARVLNDVFPPHIADILKRGDKVEPEHRPEVTLFFSDIVGFTDISGTLSPAKVSDMLDRLYTAFDKLVDKYDLFKVETIGDAYFCASNLVKDQPTHTELIARFAMDAIDAAMNTLIDLERPSLGCIKCRVGFHVGSVVTNVVGLKNPRYCLFGDTVNTASRMESSSVANHIHCSAVAADKLLAQCPAMADRVKSRGVLNIKGKGEMETFWVLLPDQKVDAAEDAAVQARLAKGVKALNEAEEMVEDAQRRASQTSKRPSRFSSGSMDVLRKRMSAAMSSVVRGHDNSAARKRSTQLFSPEHSLNHHRKDSSYGTLDRHHTTTVDSRFLGSPLYYTALRQPCLADAAAAGGAQDFATAPSSCRTSGFSDGHDDTPPLGCKDGGMADAGALRGVDAHNSSLPTSASPAVSGGKGKPATVVDFLSDDRFEVLVV